MPPRLSREARREQILDSVLDTVIQNGVNVTSKQLAEAAGIAEGTIFKAFGTKDELLKALAERYAAMPDSVGEWLRTINPGTIPLSELAYGIIEHALEQYRKSFQLFYALGPVMEQPDEEARKRFEQELEPWVDALLAHEAELRIQPAAAAAILRMHAVAAADDGSSWGMNLSAAQHADIFLHGAATCGATHT